MVERFTFLNDEVIVHFQIATTHQFFPLVFIERDAMALQLAHQIAVGANLVQQFNQLGAFCLLYTSRCV